MTIWDTFLRIKNLGLWLSVPSLPSYVVTGEGWGRGGQKTAEAAQATSVREPWKESRR